MGGHDLMSAATARIGVVKAGITIRVASIGAVVSPRVEGSACSARLHDPRASELTRPAGGSHPGRAMVYGSKL